MFKKLLLEHRKLRNSPKQMQEVMKKRDDAHNAALKKEKDEVSRLQKELEEVQNQKAETEKAAAVEKKQREEDAQKQKELLDQTEVRATSAQQELDALKAKCDIWLAELTRINHEMDSKFPLSFLFVSIACTDIKYMPVYNSIR